MRKPEERSLTEDQAKKLYTKVSAAVDGVVNPGERGPDHTIEAGQDIANLGEWEFTTNMTSINTGAGMSTRGRL